MPRRIGPLLLLLLAFTLVACLAFASAASGRPGAARAQVPPGMQVSGNVQAVFDHFSLPARGGTLIEAVIDGNVCGAGRTGRAGWFRFEVAHDSEVAGCGNDGDVITFRVTYRSPRMADETLIFVSGGAVQTTLHVRLWPPLLAAPASHAGLGAGPQTAEAQDYPLSMRIFGGLQVQASPLTFDPEGVTLEAIINGNVCDTATTGPSGLFILHPRHDLEVPGCGNDGDIITFRATYNRSRMAQETVTFVTGSGAQIALHVRLWPPPPR